MLQGEGLSVGPRAFGDHPLQALSMDAMQVGFNGHAYGWIEQFLGLYTQNPETFSELSALFLMHDHNVMGRGEMRTQNRVAVTLEKLGAYAPDDDLVFIPYWDHQGAVRSLTDGGYVNAYLHPQERRVSLLLASMKLGDAAPTEIRITLDRKKLGLPDGPLVAEDLYTGEILPVVGDELTVPVRKCDFRGLTIKPATPAEGNR